MEVLFGAPATTSSPKKMDTQYVCDTRKQAWEFTDWALPPANMMDGMASKSKGRGLVTPLPSSIAS